MRSSWTTTGVPFWVWVKHTLGVGSHDWEDEPIVNNPPWIDEQGQWRPPLVVYKCKWCTETVDSLFKPS